MAKFGKRMIISKRDYAGTGILSRFGFSGKFYLALFFLTAGLFVQCFLFLTFFNEYRREMTALTLARKKVDESLRVLLNLSGELLAKLTIGNSGASLDVSSDLSQLSQKLDIIKKDLAGEPLRKPIGMVEAAINQLKENALTTGIVSESRAIRRIYDRYLNALADLEKDWAAYCQQNRQRIFLSLLLKFGIIFLLMILTLLISRWPVKCAFLSINEPADRIIHSLKESNGNLWIKLPILASEGLGAAGLILNEGIAKWRALALELKNASNKLNYLVDELVSGFSQVFLFEVQVQEVYREIENNFNDQNRMALKVNEQIAGLISDLSGVQTIPRKLSRVSEEMNSLIAVTNEQLGRIANKPVEISGESQNIIEFLTDLSDTSERVDRIMKELEEVEAESEMLAFNSAIRAAKAGQEGQGFGIVAQEIANLVDRSKQASSHLSELIGQIQKKTGQIMEFMPDKDALKPNELTLGRTITAIRLNLNETTAGCLAELDQMRQAIEAVIAKSSETFEEFDSVSDLPRIDITELNQIKQAMGRYLESVKHTGEIADKILRTVNGLQSATDLLIKEV